jgi:hypothetical protein
MYIVCVCVSYILQLKKKCQFSEFTNRLFNDNIQQETCKRRSTDEVGSGNKSLFFHIWEIQSSTLGRDTDYTKILRVPLVPPGEERYNNSKRPRLYSYINFAIHYSSVTEPSMQQSRIYAQLR